MPDLRLRYQAADVRDECRARCDGGFGPQECLAPALAVAGLDVHLHDLRHTLNQLVAEAGANPRELMERMGHSTSRAALIYLHSTSDRQHRLADAVAARVRSELDKAAEDD